MAIDLNGLLQWQAFIAQALTVGVRSWAIIEAALADAGADAAIVEALRPKWDALVADVRAAAGPDPTES